MFNVRSLANQYAKAINPNKQINWVQSNGYLTDSAGKRTPQTITLTVNAQIQALSATDLKHIDGLNMTGVMRSVYMFGNAAGIVRVNQLGGDILVFPETSGGLNRSWLISQVIETWDDWCHVIVTLQADL